MSGNTYIRSVLLDPSLDQPGYVEYDLGRRYSTLETTIGLRDDVPARTAIVMEILGDGSPLLRYTARLGEAAARTVDVSGVLRLRLQVTDITGDYPFDVYAVFGDVRVS